MRTNKDCRTMLDHENDSRIAAWRQRMALTGGQWLVDMRTVDEKAMYARIVERGVWRMQVFMVHVHRVQDRRAAAQRERLKRASGAPIRSRQQKLI